MTPPTQLLDLNARLRESWKRFASTGGSPDTLRPLQQAIQNLATRAETLALPTLARQSRQAEQRLLARARNGFPLSASSLLELHDRLIGLKQLAAMLNPDPAHPPSASETRAETVPPSEAPYRVMIVDDDPALLAAYEQVLTQAGMAVHGVSEPMETMEAVSETDPDVILLDITLPAINGIELASTLREDDRRRHTPILFLSNEDDEQHRLLALRLGADDFLVKPVGPAHLVAAVNARAQRSRRSQRIDSRLQQTLYQLEREHAALDQHAIVSIADRRGNITYVNDKFCEISGYPREELLGQNHRIIRSVRHDPAFYQTLWQTISTGRVWTGEICNRRKDGDHYWVASTITPFLDERGRPYQYVSIRTDITAVKRNEETLRAEGELHEVINRIAGRLLSTDTDTLSATMLELLERMQDVLGTEAAFLTLLHEPALGVDYSQSWSIPESRSALAQQICHGARSEIHDGQPLCLPARHHEFEPGPNLRRIAGNEGIRSLLMLPLNHHGECHGHISFVHFSSERHWGDREIRLLQLLTRLVSQAVTRIRAEETARSHKEIMRRGQVFANIGTWEWNLVTNELYWTERIAPLFGYDDGELQTSYENFINAVHPDDRELVSSKIAACLQHDELYEVEHRVVWPDGTVRWLLERGDVVRTPDGKPLRMIGVVQDIDARKQAENELVEARKEAERANEAKSDFLSSMSHELRTPMNVILGFAQLLEYDDTLTPDQRDSTREIARAGHHLLELINDVLDLAKVESGKLSVSLEDVEVVPLIRECLLQMTPIAEDHDVTLLPHNGPEAVARADYTRLRQVLLNLVSNAIKYNRPGGSVTIQTGWREDPDWLFIQVSDTGHGIEQRQIGRLFQPFERLHTQHTVTEGTGIGLTITRRLVELMDGSIEVESHPGQGSTFQVILPVAPDSAARPAPGDAIPAPPGMIRSTTECRKRVLYVEDNPSNIKLVQQILSSQTDLELLVAPSSGLGIEMALSRSPALILLDINMPFMDGYQVLSNLKRSEALSDTPIIAVTANTMSRDIERGFAAGFDDYLTKPLDIDRLIGVLRRHLDDQPGSDSRY